MNIINYKEFALLHLDSFVPDKSDIEILDNFEFMDDVWLARCIGFTQWLSHKKNPNTKSLSLDLNNLSNESINQSYQK